MRVNADCCGFDGPIVNCPQPRLPSAQKRRKCKTYIEVPRNSAKTCFEFASLAGVAKTDWKERVQFRIYRRGHTQVTAIYDAWDLSDNGAVCVFWDSAFLGAAAGLYEAEVLLDCKPCGFVCLNLQDCRIDAVDAKHVLDDGCSSCCASCGAPADACQCNCGTVPQMANNPAVKVEVNCGNC